MSRTQLLTFLAVLVTVVATAAAARALVQPPLPDYAIVAESPTPVPGRVMPSRSADSVARRTIIRNPFRAHRSPANVRFRPEAPGEQIPSPPSPPRPSLSVAGIVLGSDPAALIDGIPGAEGTRVLRVGESVVVTPFALLTPIASSSRAATRRTNFR